MLVLGVEGVYGWWKGMARVDEQGEIYVRLGGGNLGCSGHVRS